MNLNAAAAPLTRAITPPVQAVWKRSTGYVIDPNTYDQVPGYAPDQTITVDVQPISDHGLKMLDAVSIQGVACEVWTDNMLRGIDREAQLGGDLLVIASGDAAGTWLVHTLMEPWRGAGWTHALCIKQVTP